MEKEQLKKSYSDMKDFLKEVKSHSLHISRIPIKTKEKFIEIANNEFAGDYGMLIKFLLDGLVDTDVQELNARVDELEQKIYAMENIIQNLSSEEKSDNSIKLLNGKKIKND